MLSQDGRWRTAPRRNSVCLKHPENTVILKALTVPITVLTFAIGNVAWWAFRALPGLPPSQATLTFFHFSPVSGLYGLVLEFFERRPRSASGQQNQREYTQTSHGRLPHMAKPIVDFHKYCQDRPRSVTRSAIRVKRVRAFWPLCYRQQLISDNRDWQVVFVEKKQRRQAS